MRQSGTVIDPRTIAQARVLEAVDAEVARAISKFPPFNSPHEGWAVIKEELDELWKEVTENNGRRADAMTEAVQIAAMAVRYVMDLDGGA